MARRKDPNLLLEAEHVGSDGDSFHRLRNLQSYFCDSSITATKREVEGNLYRGFELSVSPNVRVVLKSPLAWYPFRHLPDSTGWYVCAIGSGAEGSMLKIALTELSSGRCLAEQTISIRRALSSIRLPIPFGSPIDAKDTELQMTFIKKARGKVFLAVHRILDRAEALRLCEGFGVEIGPGLQPQVLPNDRREVMYIEEASSDQWNAHYNERGRVPFDASLWDRYHIGQAFPLPVENDALDFVFSSHVFEHLANPLGHLEHWHSKLKAKGVVVGIVPDLAGTKDYVFEPSSFEQFLTEYESGRMEPTLTHYRHWAHHRAPGKNPEVLLESRRSIHVHFYTNHNMARLLDQAVRRLGYSWFNIRHTPNHKDFYFVLGK
jgi:hypothetical protein